MRRPRRSRIVHARIDFIASVFACLARRARALSIPPGAKGFRSGAVNVIQRYGGALNLNVHSHAVFIDGVYTRDDPLATARFHELPPPSQEDVEWTLARVHARIQRLLERRLDEESLPEGETLLARLASASVRGRQATGTDRDEPLEGLFTPPTDPRSTAPPSLLARGAGFSLHAGVAVEADRRGRLEHLCRYIARPPLAVERLSLDERGRIAPLPLHRAPPAGRRAPLARRTRPHPPAPAPPPLGRPHARRLHPQEPTRATLRPDPQAPGPPGHLPRRLGLRVHLQGRRGPEPHPRRSSPRRCGAQP